MVHEVDVLLQRGVVRLPGRPLLRQPRPEGLAELTELPRHLLGELQLVGLELPVLRGALLPVLLLEPAEAGLDGVGLHVEGGAVARELVHHGRVLRLARGDLLLYLLRELVLQLLAREARGLVLLVEDVLHLRPERLQHLLRLLGHRRTRHALLVEKRGHVRDLPLELDVGGRALAQVPLHALLAVLEPRLQGVLDLLHAGAERRQLLLVGQEVLLERVELRSEGAGGQVAVGLLLLDDAPQRLPQVVVRGRAVAYLLVDGLADLAEAAPRGLLPAPPLVRLLGDGVPQDAELLDVGGDRLVQLPHLPVQLRGLPRPGVERLRERLQFGWDFRIADRALLRLRLDLVLDLL
mmetsp:Transcript_27511/g.77826  ORF Transcript_27511/g.77826 Transcript_27511/m.77826 type:complete len:351 (+) Transcript_27511:419-1471(+)